MTLFILCIIFYLIGSIPFGVIISGLRNTDIRSLGSGNPGAANVYRSLGFLCGFLTFMFDSLKAYLPLKIYTGLYGFSNYIYLFAFCIVAGHCYSVFLKLRGGKGVSASAGILGFFSLAYLVPFFIFYGILAGIVKISSVSSLGALFLSCISILLVPVKSYDKPVNIFVYFILIFIFVMLMHKENIKRLINKNELQI